MTEQSVVVESHLEPSAPSQSPSDEIRQSLGRYPKELSPKWLYDDAGSDLFDQITRLPDYYLTESERDLLREHADEIAEHTGSDTLVELGSGTSDKTTTLLDAFEQTGQLATFVPFDVSEATLIEAAHSLAERYPEVNIHAVVGDFHNNLADLPTPGNRLVAFLGSTLGNFHVEERRALLGALADVLGPDEWLLLGVDLVKDVSRILAAYNDETGLTEAFIKNVLNVVNQQIGSDFDPDRFDYIPFWDPHQERVDIRLRADMPHTVRVGDDDLDFAEGEELRVEVSTKFRPERLTEELSEMGLIVERTFINEDFGLLLARKSAAQI